MSSKRYTIAEKIEICEKIIAAEKEGISIYKSSKDFQVSDVTIYGWIRKYKAGTLTGESEENKEHDIPTSLLNDLVEEFNGIGSVKVEMVDVLVFSESVENHIFVSVEKPDITDIEKFSNELNQRILDKLQWCFAIKGFKF